MASIDRLPGSPGGKSRSSAHIWNEDAIKRIGCAIFEEGLATPDELCEWITDCVPDEDKPCQKEKSLIEQSYPLLLAGLATLTLALPVLRLVRTASSVVRGFLSSIPWLGRFFAIEAEGASTTIARGAVAGSSFEAAAAGLTPEYLQAVATSQSILSRLQVATKAEGIVAVLLGIAGFVGSSFDVFPEDDGGA